MVDAGYDALSVDLGCYDAHYWNHPSVYQRDGLYLEAAEMVKKVVDVPILVAGRMDNPDFGSKSIEEGKCDILAIGRPLLADPELPNKVATGNLDIQGLMLLLEDINAFLKMKAPSCRRFASCILRGSRLN